MKDKFKMRFLGVVSIILLCIGCTIKSFQNDTFYVLKLGEYITSHGIDLMDHYCWIASLSYTYPHWLYDVVMYFIYAGFGYTGIYVSTIVLFIILVLTIYVVHLKMHHNEFLALIISIFSISWLFVFATARAQLVTIILFVLEVFFIERLIQTGKTRYVFLLGLISLVVANVHATIWLFYFILYLPFLGEHVIYRLTRLEIIQKLFPLKEDGKIMVERGGHIKKLLLSLVLSFMMGLFTPSKICYTYIFRVMLGNSQEYIREHASLVVIDQPVFLVLGFVGLLILIFTKTKIRLKELFMISGLLFMSLVSQRHLIFFYTIGLLYLSVLACRCLENRKDKTLDILGMLLVRNKIIYGLCIMAVGVFSFSRFQKNYAKDYVPVKEYPVEAVEFIHQNLEISTIRLYNDYNVGSYLLYHNIPVFIDSRCDLYLSEFNGLGYSIFDDAMEIEYIYEEKFEFYDVTHVLVQKKDIFYQILSKDQNYHVIYRDKNFVLFEVKNYG